MLQRCLNPKNTEYKNYGGRGITIYPPWIDDYVAFRDYINQNLGPCPKDQTLDRINNDGNYEPGNLHWAPQSVQRLNARTPKLNQTSFKGVYQRGQQCTASISHNNKTFHLGTFNTPEEAHTAYCKKAKELHGKFFCAG